MDRFGDVSNMSGHYQNYHFRSYGRDTTGITIHGWEIMLLQWTNK